MSGLMNRGKELFRRRVEPEKEEQTNPTMTWTCQGCGHSPQDSNGCPISFLFKHRKPFQRIKYGREKDLIVRPFECPSCGCQKGTFHHVDCDVEECPKCASKIVHCSCHLEYSITF